MLKKAYFTLLFLLYLHCVFAQQHYQHFDKFTIQDGLPSNVIYSLLQDSKGYLWVGTTNGLAKYDGYKFTVFKQTDDENSIKGHKIETIFEDSAGYIWVGSSCLSKYNREKDTWESYTFHKEGKKSSSNDFIRSIIQENDSILWLSSLNGIIRFNKKTDNYRFFLYQDEIIDYKAKIVDIKPNSYLLISGKTRFYKFNLEKFNFSEIKIDRDDSKNYSPICSFYNKYYIQKNVLINNIYQRTIIIANFKEEKTFEIKIDQGKIIPPLQYYKNSNNLYLTSTNKILKFNKQNRLIDSVNLYNLNLNKESAFNLNSFLCGKEKCYWIGTNDGLFRINRKKAFHKLNKNNGLPNEYIRSVLVDNNILYIGTKHGHSYKINNLKKFVNKKSTKINPITYLPYCLNIYATNSILKIRSKQQIVFLGSSSIYQYDAVRDKVISCYNAITYTGYWSLVEEDQGILVGSMNNPCLTKFRYEGEFLVKDTSYGFVGDSPIVHKIYKDKKYNIWIGGQGMFKLHQQTDGSYQFEKYLDYEDSITKRKNPVWSIIDFDKNHLLVGTTENGLFLINKQTKKTLHFTTKDGLSSNCVSGILLDNNKNIWISTISGLNFYDVSENTLTIYRQEDGLPDEDFNFKACDKTDDSWLFFGTKKGILYFHPDSIIQNEYQAPLYVNEFRVLDSVIKKELKDNEKIILNHKQNFFTLEYSLLEYKDPKSTRYEYFLENYDNKIRKTTGEHPTSSYTNVPPGEYVFHLTAINPQTLKISNQLKIPIKIVPAFYQTKAFKAGVIIIIFMVISLIIYLLFKRQLYKSRLLTTELSLLRSQMNPHFIFNTLNSIQGYVLNNDKMRVFNYISKFAKLMRMSLDYSKTEYVSVEETLKYLKTYVMLESERLQEEVEFIIEIDNEIDVYNTLVSPMTIQPFVENALKHGLKPKGKDMKLHLELRKSYNYLACIVSDNGIGRDEARKIKEKKNRQHKSHGIEITQRSMSLQMKDNKTRKNQIKFTDHYDENGEPTGTSVLLKISYLYKDE